MKTFPRSLPAWAAILLLAGSLQARAATDADRCTDPPPGTSPDLIIGYCTQAMQSGGLSNPERIAVFGSRAIAYAQEGKYDQAIADFSEVILLNPDFAKAYYDRGLIYMRKGDDDSAIADYTRAIRLDPSIEQFFNNRGNAYNDKGEYDLAIKDYNQAIRLNSKDPKFFLNRGNAYDNRGDYDRAIADLDQAIRLKPDFFNAFLDLGNTYRDKGDYDFAIADYSRALELDPNDVPSLENRGRIRFEQEQYDLAATDLAKVVRLAPTNFYDVLWLYLAQTRAKQAGAAAALTQNAQHLDLGKWPGPVVSLYLGKTTAAAVLAAADNVEADKRKGEQCEAAFYVGERLLGQGQKKEAAEKFHAALAVCPPNYIEVSGAKAELKNLGIDDSSKQ